MSFRQRFYTKLFRIATNGLIETHKHTSPDAPRLKIVGDRVYYPSDPEYDIAGCVYCQRGERH